MKAIIQKRYGGPEQLEMIEVDVPTYKDNEILIEVYYSNVASGDMRINMLDAPTILKPVMRLIFGFKGPRNQIRGVTGSGVVSEVGRSVTKFKKGDRVYFINSLKAGTLAEYIALKESAVIANVPDNFPLSKAAPLAFGAMSALHFINQKNIQQNDQVLIYGASGSVGSYAVQLARFYGGEVTAVSSKKNHPKLETLGAIHLIDYQTTDFRDAKKQYDVIFDAVMKLTKSSCKNVLKKSGKYLSIKSPTSEKVEKLVEINRIIKEEKLDTLIDTIYPFDQYKEAHAKVYTKHKVGNVIIEIKKEETI